MQTGERERDHPHQSNFVSASLPVKHSLFSTFTGKYHEFHLQILSFFARVTFFIRITDAQMKVKLLFLQLFSSLSLSLSRLNKEQIHQAVVTHFMSHY